MNVEEAYQCGVRSQNMDSEQATRAFYSVCGIHSIITGAPASANSNDVFTYEYWCPERDPPSDVLNSFYEGYYNG